MAKLFLLFLTIVEYISIDFCVIALNNTIGKDQLIPCDLKNIENFQNKKNLCKIECYTELGNPGICQTQVLNPCKTLAVNTNAKKCNRSSKDSRFKSICCPFEHESKLKPTNKPSMPSTVFPIDDKECGERPDIAAIVGGFDAEPNTWPWIVSIYERQTPTSEPYFICGGAIISNRFVLSAAHCFVRMRGAPIQPNKYLIKLGAYRLSDTNIKFSEISEIIAHKSYNTIQRYNDIALLRVKTPIKFNPTISPICLPKGSLFDNKDFVGFPTKLIGWGATRFTGPISDTLQEVEVRIIDNRKCNQNYSQIIGHESGFPNGINKQFICAGLPEGGKDSCQGDSGGPLAIEIDGKWYELGIVSFGYKCAEPAFPGIYTRVEQFINWIEINTK